MKASAAASDGGSPTTARRSSPPEIARSAQGQSPNAIDRFAEVAVVEPQRFEPQRLAPELRAGLVAHSAAGGLAGFSPGWPSPLPPSGRASPETSGRPSLPPDSMYAPMPRNLR